MSSKSSSNSFFISILKGTVYAVIGMLLGVLIFAIFVKAFYMSNTAIKVVNQIIKAFAIIVACFLSVKDEKGLIKGALIGLLGCIFTQLIFSVIGSQSLFSIGFLVDCIIGALVGAIGGVVAVNLRAKNA